MKNTIEVSFYNWTDSYEVHVYCTGTEHMVLLFWDCTVHPYEWQLQHIDSNVPPDTIIPDLTTLSEEEYFQQSISWDKPMDFYLVHAVQKHILENKQKWEDDTFYSEELEY